MKRWILLLAVLALVVMGCAPAEDAEVQTDSDGVGAEQPDATGDPAEAAAPGVLNFSWGTPGGSVYDPHVSTNPFVYVFLHPAYDRLVGIDDEGDPVPQLAESFEFVDDNAALVLQLRDDVVFHDGEPFNAEAVVANIERGQTLETSTVKADLASVESAEAVDEYTVRLNLSAPA